MSDLTDREIAEALMEWADGEEVIHVIAAERLIGRSVLLNRIAWRLHEALGVIPDGADRYDGDIAADLDQICDLIRVGLSHTTSTDRNPQ